MPAPHLCVPLLISALWAADPPTDSASSASSAPESGAAPKEVGEVAQEPEGGTGVSPVELIPRVEFRQGYTRLSNGVSLNTTSLELDNQFFRRMLVRFETPLVVMKTPAGQVSGMGDIKLETLIVLMTSKRFLLGAIGGAILDTATQAPLGAGKEQVFFGGGAALKPYRWWLGYLVAQEQLSVGGDAARTDVNQLAVRFGNILFGKQFNWFKVDLDTVVDFEGGNGRFFGTLELGSLLVGRVGMFVRAGTQLLGPDQVDYTLAGGLRYLFRLGTSRPK